MQHKVADEDLEDDDDSQAGVEEDEVCSCVCTVMIQDGELVTHTVQQGMAEVLLAIKTKDEELMKRNFFPPRNILLYSSS